MGLSITMEEIRIGTRMGVGNSLQGNYSVLTFGKDKLDWHDVSKWP